MDQSAHARPFEGYGRVVVRIPPRKITASPARSQLPTACRRLFRIHAVDISDDPHTKNAIRGLYQGKGKKGWVFFTQVCGRTASVLQPNNDIRAFFWEWASQGYGVIVRLNHGYEPGGTLPEKKYYDGFATAAARWVELFLKHTDVPTENYTWTIQIANEQNNPREHPGGFDIHEHISERCSGSVQQDLCQDQGGAA